MSKERVKAHIKRSLILAFVTTAQVGCAQEPDTIEPYFSGLSSGVSVSESCINFGSYAINVSEAEGDQVFDVYAGKLCDKEKRLLTQVLGVEANLAGVWNEYLVFDEGTDVNGRDLRLFSLKHEKESFVFPYESEPVFSSSIITFYAPSKTTAVAEDCVQQTEEFVQWREFEMEVRIGYKQQFSAETKAVSSPAGEHICYGLQ